VKRVGRILGTLLVGLAFASCATTMIQQDDLTSIHKGMTPADVKAALKAEPSFDLAVDDAGVPCTVDIFEMQTGTRRWMTVERVWSKYGDITYPTTNVAPVTEEYLFIFDAGGLIYWGFRNDLAREDDPRIRAMVPLIDQEYEEQKAKNSGRPDRDKH
jgi:hypothetical protein